MERMDKNVMRIMALDLDLPSVLSLCRGNKRLNKEICDSQLFWRDKLHQDYPLTRKFQKGDFKRIYESLRKNERIFYYIMVSENNPPGVPLKIWDYTIKNEDYYRDNNSNKYSERAEKLPDFDERKGEESEFYIVGDFPKGTKAWLVYSEDHELKNSAFLTKEDAKKYLFDYVASLLKQIYRQREDMEEFYGATLEQLVGYHTAEEALEDFEKLIETQGYFLMPSFNEGNNVQHYMLQEITL